MKPKIAKCLYRNKGGWEMKDFNVYDDGESSYFWRQFFKRLTHEWGCLAYHGIGGCTCRSDGPQEQRVVKLY